MGVTAQLTVNDKADGIHIGIKASRGGEALGGGRRAGVVESLAYLVNKAINREEQGRKWVFLEVGSEATGGGESPDVSTQMQGPVDPAAQAIAEEMVAKCKKMGGVLWIGPLASGQRNQLQYALSKIAGVRVKAEGEGHHRRLVIEAS
jgi:predicted RNA-binding protein Jag